MQEEGAASTREGLGAGPEPPRTLSLPSLGQLELTAPSTHVPQEPSGCRLDRTRLGAQGRSDELGMQWVKTLTFLGHLKTGAELEKHSSGLCGALLGRRPPRRVLALCQVCSRHGEAIVPQRLQGQVMG